jgi:hypothetical protein
VHALDVAEVIDMACRARLRSPGSRGWRRAFRRLAVLPRLARVTSLATTLLFATSLASVAAPSASAAGCPNEALRSQIGSAQLPDCRAYELVTPPAKNGEAVEVGYVSSNGERLVVYSIGGFAGDSQTSVLDYYELQRGPTGWETKPFNLPQTYVYAEASVLSVADSELTKGLFAYRQAGDPVFDDAHVYTRNPLVGGSIVEVGPKFSPVNVASHPSGVPTSSPLSASPDLTHVAFLLSGPAASGGALLDAVWPGDTTATPKVGSGFDSLYEYVGTGQEEPKLVGVRNEGVLAHDSEAELIGQCGTTLGFPENGVFTNFSVADSDNAITTNDEAGVARTFFTVAAQCAVGTGPATNELYAREENLATGYSRSIPISEPTSGSGGACELCNTSAPAGAVFQGASSDGSKLFFLTTQRLLPGAAGESLYEYDFDAPLGRRVSLVASEMDEEASHGALQGVVRVSQDGSHVYFVAGSVLTEAPRGGGCLTELSAVELAEEEITHEGRCRPKHNLDNLYVYDTLTGQTAFVATLAAGDEADWQQLDERPADATPDGQHLLFESRADLTVNDHSRAVQIFEYDAQSEALALVSHGANGSAGNPAEEVGARIVFPTYTQTSNPSPRPGSLSNNGAFAAFESSAALTPQAANGRANVYEYHEGVVSLISKGETGQSSFLRGIDGSGEDIYFATTDQLVPQDTDTQQDVYDARIDGGFPAPMQATSCEGEACQGAPAAPPVFGGVPGSATLPGVENLASPSTPASAVNAKPLTRAQKLAKALKTCRRERQTRRRVACEQTARKKIQKSA